MTIYPPLLFLPFDPCNLAGPLLLRSPSPVSGPGRPRHMVNDLIFAPKFSAGPRAPAPGLGNTSEVRLGH